MFGASMSDHMLEVDWTAERGWGTPTIVPYHALQLDPAASSLHYGIEVRSAAWVDASLGAAASRAAARLASERLGGESLRRRLCAWGGGRSRALLAPRRRNRCWPQCRLYGQLVTVASRTDALLRCMLLARSEPIGASSSRSRAASLTHGHPRSLAPHPPFAAAQAFEGMKAYRDSNGGIRLFRPDLNMRRLKVRLEEGGACERLCHCRSSRCRNTLLCQSPLSTCSRRPRAPAALDVAAGGPAAGRGGLHGVHRGAGAAREGLDPAGRRCVP